MKTLTSDIFKLTAPYNNPYQGSDKRVLFVCSAGLLRSATCARVFADKHNTRAAGSSPYALIPVSANLVAWADEIVFVNKENHEETCKNFDLSNKNVKVLNIPDQFEHMNPRLIEIIKEQYID